MWVVIEKDGHIVGSVVYELDEPHHLAKVFGALVLPEHRKQGLVETAVTHSDNYLIKERQAVKIIYATTRTNSPAPQRVLRKLGYKNLGIFPNIHKTDKYETHCLTAKFADGVLETKFNDFKIHPKIIPIYWIVQKDCRLPDPEIAQPGDYSVNIEEKEQIPPLEIIDAPAFVTHRFKLLKQQEKLMTNFFPFHEPNILLTSPCQKVEVFVFLSATDQHSTIIGMKLPEFVSFAGTLSQVSRRLQEAHARYIEIMARTCFPRMIEAIIETDFIPCGYFPAFQPHQGNRYDYALFSKTFETLSFKNLAFDGWNKAFAEAYYRLWKERAMADFE